MIGRVSNSGEINAKKKAHYILFSTKIKKSLLFMSQIKSSGVKYQEKKAIKQKKKHRPFLRKSYVFNKVFVIYYLKEIPNPAEATGYFWKAYCA